MKKAFTVMSLVFVSVVMFAQAYDGLSCETAIPVDTSYSGSIDAPGVYYYSAWTYDLPLACYFYPNTEEVSELYLDVDFTCTPGVYDDPKIVDLLDATSGWGVKMPIRFDDFEQGVDDNGRAYYTLSIQETYREMMANFGITYDVQALIKVTTSVAGDIRMAPDTTFKSCVENSIWLNLPDTIHTGVLKNDERYVLPLADWDNDSIRYRWTGVQAPVQVWIGDRCDFELSTTGENCAVDMFTLYPDAGNAENIYEMSRQMIWDMINMLEKGGIYYMRVISTEDAELIVERQAVEGPLANAIKLEFDVPVKVKANDFEQVYYFPIEWESKSVEFVSSVPTSVVAGVFASIELDGNTSGFIEMQQFVSSSSDARWQLSEKEMGNLCKGLSDEYVYVKFISEKPTTITPLRWAVGDCVNKSTEIFVTDSVRILAKTSSAVYRINYDQWSKYDVKVYWSSVGDMKAYLTDTCGGFTLRPTNEHVLLYNEYVIDRYGMTDTLTITSEQMKTFADRIDGDGYLYFRFNANSYGDLLVTSVLVDSSYIEPEPAKVIALKLDSMIDVPMEDMQQTYCFTRDWENISVEFTTNTADSVIAYMGTKADFELFEPETGYIAQYPFFKQNDQSRLQLSAKQLSTLLNSSIADTIFVSFYAFDDVQITPILWNACACVENSFELMPNDQKVLAANSENTIYRVNYNQWQAHDVRLHWAGSLTLWAYLGYTCDFNLSATNKYVLNGNDVDILPNDTMVIGEEVRMKAIDWGRLPADGFLYFRFHGQSEGVLTSSIINRGNGGPTTGIYNVSMDVQRHQLFCTPEGVIYILVDGERYTLLGEKL